MNSKRYETIAIVNYVLSLLTITFFIKVRLTSEIYLKTQPKLILLFIVCLLIYVNGYILVKKLNYNKTILKFNLIIYFLIYNVIIFSLTLFDELYGRRGFSFINWNSEILKTYMKYSFNIVPFKTIKLFINGYTRGIVSFRAFYVNVIGNLVAFMPYGVFLPLLYKGMNKYKNFLTAMIFIVIIIELLQFATISGSCDIDDLMLNILGASIVYFMMKVKVINKLVRKILLYE